MHRYSAKIARLLTLLWINALFAFDDSLGIEQSALLDSIISTFRIEYCCGASLKTCLNEKNGCLIAVHLHDFSRWLVQKNINRVKIMEQLEKRYEGFTSTEQHAIDTSQTTWAGSLDAPVRIVAYVSSSCNFCKHIVGILYDSVTTHSLSGKIKLMAIPFGTGIGDIALFAANSQGKFWPLFNLMRNNKKRYKEADILKMAAEAGIEGRNMKKHLEKPEFHQMVSDARKEGAGNGVETTPTFFINEKRYSSYKDPEWIIDAAKFELHRIDANKE